MMKWGGSQEGMLSTHAWGCMEDTKFQIQQGIPEGARLLALAVPPKGTTLGVDHWHHCSLLGESWGTSAQPNANPQATGTQMSAPEVDQCA